jgi:hypothetical protein
MATVGKMPLNGPIRDAEFAKIHLAKVPEVFATNKIKMNRSSNRASMIKNMIFTIILIIPNIIFLFL